MDSGMVLSPGGIIVMISMPLVGLLISKVQAKWLIIIWFSVRLHWSFYVRWFHYANQLLECRLGKECYVHGTWVFIYPN